MNSLMETYVEMQKIAADSRETQERLEVLEKYASAAEEMLESEYGNDYEAEDVEKLASVLIEHDIEVEDENEKVAEWAGIGASLYHTMKEEG